MWPVDNYEIMQLRGRELRRMADAERERRWLRELARKRRRRRNAAPPPVEREVVESPERGAVEPPERRADAEAPSPGGPVPAHPPDAPAAPADEPHADVVERRPDDEHEPHPAA